MRSLAWDGTGLLHAARVDRADVLGDFALGPDQNWAHVTTAVVEVEVTRLGGFIPDWVSVLPDDGSLDSLIRFEAWAQRVGASTDGINAGEATVFVEAERHGYVAIVDDADATRTGRRYGLDVHGTLWVIAQRVTAGQRPLHGASTLVDLMMADGFRTPFPYGGFGPWARKVGLLP